MANIDLGKEVNKFIESMIEEKAYPNLPEDAREQMRQELTAKLNDMINARVLAQMTDKQLNTFETLLKENATQERVYEYITSVIPDTVNFLTTVMLDFRSIYLGQV